MKNLSSGNFWRSAVLATLSLHCSIQSENVESTASADDEVINGTASFGPEAPYMAQPTVRIRTPQGKVCTGTAIRNDSIVTARHCVTTDANIDGPLAAANQVSVASSGLAPGIRCNTPTCRTGSQIFTTSTTQDVALLILSGSINVNGTSFGHSVKIDPFDPGSYATSQLRVTGYGANTTTGDGAGTLRGGFVNVVSTDGTWESGWANTGRVIETQGVDTLDVGGQLLWSADSGGPNWNQLLGDPANTNQTQVAMLLGVHSRRNNGSNTAIAHATVSSAFRSWVNQEIFNHTPSINNALTASIFMFSLEVREPVAGTSGPTRWNISASGLSEPSNFNNADAGTMILHRNNVYENFDMQVTFTGTDNDSVGLVFWYRDDRNYLRFLVDEQTGLARLVRMHPGGPVTLAENLDFPVDFNPGATLRVRTSGSNIQAFIDGVRVFNVNDIHIMAGRVGFYDNAMAGGFFRNWTVTPLTPTNANVPR